MDNVGRHTIHTVLETGDESNARRFPSASGDAYAAVIIARRI